MENLFVLVSLLAFCALIAGLIKPSVVKCSSRGKVFLIYFSAFMVSSIILSTISEDTPASSEPKTTESSTDPVEEKTEKEPKEEKKVKTNFGKSIEVGDFAYQINHISFRKSVGTQYIHRTSDGMYLLVHLYIKNISKETQILHNSLFSVSDEDGNTYEASIDASSTLEMSGVETLLLKECHPNITTQGYLVFEVPSQGEYSLNLSGGGILSWWSSTKKILLK
ncbi:MAG: DUF4352 domain-containing protein [Coprobacter sp.]|nr:DUF4352 domain-containing protein [Coprobacter sp.]